MKEHHHWKEGRVNPRSIDGMEKVFDAFCTFAGGKAGAMGVATWNKMLQDTGLYDSRWGVHRPTFMPTPYSLDVG